MQENETVIPVNIQMPIYFWGDYIFTRALAPFSCLRIDVRKYLSNEFMKAMSNNA